MIIEAFGHELELVNEDKVTRAVFGTTMSDASHKGGVGEDATGEQKVTEYDRLGGLIKLAGSTVKRGCFYDLKTRKPAVTPVVMLTFEINGKTVVVPADEPLPPLVRAAKEAEQGAVSEAREEEGDDAAAPKSTAIGPGKTGSRAKPKKDADEDAD